MIQNKKTSEGINKNKVYIADGTKKYYTDILNMKFYEGEVEYSLQTLLSTIVKLDAENTALKLALSNYIAAENTMDNMITETVDNLSKKIVLLGIDIAAISEKGEK